MDCPTTAGVNGPIKCSTAYSEYGCRCDACRNWKSEKHRQTRQSFKSRNKCMRCGDTVKNYTRCAGCRQKEARYNETYREENPEYFRKWQKANADKHRAVQARRRARKANTTAVSSDYEEVLRQAQNIYAKQGHDVHVDHIVPLSRGGEHVPENLRLVKAKDNLQKKDRLDSELDFEIEPLPIPEQAYELINKE